MSVTSVLLWQAGRRQENALTLAGQVAWNRQSSGEKEICPKVKGEYQQPRLFSDLCTHTFLCTCLNSRE